MTITDAQARPLAVTHVLWRLSRGGGVQTVMRTLIAATDAKQVAIRVVTARPRLAEDGLDELPVPVVGLGHVGERLRVRNRLRLLVAVARDVRSTRPDVVQLHSGTVWLGALARLAVRRVGFVIEVHDAPGSGRHGRVTDRLEGWFARWTRTMVVCHSSSVEAAVRARWKIPPTGVVRFPLSVDLALFAPSPAGRATARDALGIAPEARVVLVVGRVVPSKRFDLAVEALAHTTGDPAPLLLVVGDGPQRAALLERAVSLGLAERVVAPGTRFGSDLADAYRAADVLLSTSDYEGFGLTLVEAMAAGLPVVATSVGGVTDIVVEGETGHLVPPGDVAEVVAALQGLLDDPAERAAMGGRGLDQARQRYAPARLAESFRDVYRRVSGGGRS